jgi:hypothetical protein
MATRRKEETETNPTGKGKIKFRYTDQDKTLDFSMENVTDQAVAEGLRSLGNALAGRTIVGEGRRLPKPKPQELGAAPAGENGDQEVETPAHELAEEVEELEPTGEEIENGHEPSKPRRVAKPKAPKLLSNLKLTDAKVSLADFMSEKKPDPMWDKYAVVAVWYKEQFQITEISIDHIFTAFKHLGWDSQLPTSIVTPLKNLTHNRKWFDVGKEKGTYAINWLGESEVGKMGGATK